MLGARPLRSIEMKLILAAAVMVVFLFGTGMGFYRESWAFLADLDRQEQNHSLWTGRSKTIVASMR